MDEFVVTGVISTVEGSDKTHCWRVTSKSTSGIINVYLMPQQIVAWRIAEYDIDPEDSETIWDIIMHERLMGELLDTEGDPAESAGLVVDPTPAMRSMMTEIPDGGKLPLGPYFTNDPALALKAQKLRVAKVKEKVAKVNIPVKTRDLARAPAHPMDVLLAYRPTTKDLAFCRDKVKSMLVELGVGERVRE